MRARIEALAARICLNVFIWMYSRKWTGIPFVVHEEAKRGATEMLRQWLTYHRFQHCRRCLGLGKLRKTIIVEDEQVVYLCEKCWSEGDRAGATRPALDLVKP